MILVNITPQIWNTVCNHVYTRMINNLDARNVVIDQVEETLWDPINEYMPPLTEMRYFLHLLSMTRENQ